jgi:hypothetical protein
MDLWEGYWEVRSCQGDSDKPGLGPLFTIWLRRVGIRLSLTGDRRHQPLQRYVKYTVGPRYHIAARSRYHVSDGRFVHEAQHQSQNSANMLLFFQGACILPNSFLFWNVYNARIVGEPHEYGAESNSAHNIWIAEYEKFIKLHDTLRYDKIQPKSQFT